MNTVAKTLIPAFWANGAGDERQSLFNYRKIWFISIFALVVVSLLPLTLFVAFDYQISYESIKNESFLRTLRITSNTRRSVRYFLEERLDALRFIVRDIPFASLEDNAELNKILNNMKMGFGGFVDIGLINWEGIQVNYAGPFEEVQGKVYREQQWFSETLRHGAYVSDVFLGYRQLPHMIVAVKSVKAYENPYIVRATLDIGGIVDILASLDMSERSDAFLCNHEGVLQTPSKYHGGLLEKIDIPMPPVSEKSRVLEMTRKNGEELFIGYAYIENSPYILMLVKQKKNIMKGWYTLRRQMVSLFLLSIIVIILVVYGLSTFMVNKVHDADRARLVTLEHMESNSRLISIGRLAAGVAHEINNPLAIINENAGLLKDLMTYGDKYNADEKLLELVDDILASVERCGHITKELLGFARHFEPKIEPLNLERVIRQVLSFVKKEAAYRNIEINVDVPEDFPAVHTDRGKMQQILLNLTNNAFQAMNDGGHFEIRASLLGEDTVEIRVKDDGCGILVEDQAKIFDPFFTKGKKGGTGLGLSITHGLIRKMGGDISVESDLGKGTTFVITLPITNRGEEADEGLTCG